MNTTRKTEIKEVDFVCYWCVVCTNVLMRREDFITCCQSERLDRRTWKGPGSEGKLVTVTCGRDFILDFMIVLTAINKVNDLSIS